MDAATWIRVELPHECTAAHPVSAHSAWNRPSLGNNINRISLLNFKKKDHSEGKEKEKKNLLEKHIILLLVKSALVR